MQSDVAVAAAPPETSVPPRPERAENALAPPVPYPAPPPPPSFEVPLGEDPPPPPTTIRGVEVSLPIKIPENPPPELPL